MNITRIYLSVKLQNFRTKIFNSCKEQFWLDTVFGPVAWITSFIDYTLIEPVIYLKKRFCTTKRFVESIFDLIFLCNSKSINWLTHRNFIQVRLESEQQVTNTACVWPATRELLETPWPDWQVLQSSTTNNSVHAIRTMMEQGNSCKISSCSNKFCWNKIF